MLKRDYQAPEFNVRDTREIRGGQVAAADTRAAAPIRVGDDSWRTRMIEQLGNQAVSTLSKLEDLEYSNQYLEGQAAAGVVESEAELEGNPLTRDWKVAGYRDTMGKLALADSEAQFSVDIAKLREKDPAEMQAYLAQRRSKMMPALAGMSREARAAAAGQLLLQDRAAIKSHATEHTKFIIEQKSQAVQAQANTSMRMLGSAQARFRLKDITQEEFNRQLQSTAGTMVGSVWGDNTLPDDVKKNLTFEMIQMALSNDSVELYDYLAQTEIPDGTGGVSTLMSRLDGKQQQQLANTYREAQSRTNDQRNFFHLEQVENIEAQLDNNMYRGTYEDLREVVEPLVMRKVITGERGAGLLGKFIGEQYKTEEQSAIFGMALQGDTHGLLMAGKTQKDGIDAIDAGLARAKATPEKVLSTYLQAGKNGLDGAFQRVGTILGSSLRQIRGEDGTVLPQHRDTFLTINREVRAAEARGNRNARMQVLSGLSEQDRMFATRVFALVDGPGDGRGKTLDEAIAIASDSEAKEEAMTPSVRAATAQNTSKLVAQAVAEIEPMNWLEESWTFVKSIFSDDAKADLRMRVESDIGFRDGILSDNPTAKQYAVDVREAVQEEANRVLLVSPTANPEDVISTAKANVAARTVQTRHGPIVLPHRANASQLFGVSAANLSKVGPAIDKMLEETKADARWHVQFRHRGVFVQEYDRDGVPVGNGNYLKPTDVRSAVQGLMESERSEADARYGDGRKVMRDGVTLKYNGNNTAGVPNSWMLGLRDNLFTNEGLKAKPYVDLSGKRDKAGRPIMTVGVGVSSHNPRYPKPGPDGTIGPDEIRRSFLEASNDAAIAGRRAAQSAGLDNKHGFALMSELAYQSGVGFLQQENKTGARYREFAQALQSKNVQTAKEAFKRTAAWYYSADQKKPNVLTDRQKHYLKLIENSIQGA